tara:strand:+ start:5 stop:955 length:951 start_codon:yes stop_codon:yes gene_type:complete
MNDMKTKHVFITGASGCVGHYLIQECLNLPNLHVHVLVRYPEKLKFSDEDFKRITVHIGDFKQIEKFESVVKKMNFLIHGVTEWWGEEQTHLVNVTKTREFFMMIDPAICEQIVYFSTASVLGKGNKVVKEAKLFGSSYIRSKYNAYHMIQEIPIKDKITVMFPTMVFGGNNLFPKSHITKGVSQAFSYLKYLRFIHVDGAFHFIHSADIAKMSVYFMLNPKKYREYVLGNFSVSVKDALKVLYTQFNMKPLFRIHVKKWFLNVLTVVFRIKVGPWEKYCMDNSYMIFDAVNPKTFGLKGEFETLDSLIEDIKSFK